MNSSKSAQKAVATAGRNSNCGVVLQHVGEAQTSHQEQDWKHALEKYNVFAGQR